MKHQLKLVTFSILIYLFALQSLVICDEINERDGFPVSIIHMNDFHARFEETDIESATCKKDEGKKCIGGYARAVTIIKELLEARKLENPIYLNAGDNFQGTVWYNILRWNVTSYFLNLLPADAMTIGNHEFDNKIEGVVPFLETINSPVVVCNIDDSEEPTIQGLYQKSIVIDKYERKIGIIGVILATTNQIADTGDLKFLDESESILAEAEKLKTNGVDIIIVLSHCGLDVDKIIAEKCGDAIDVIVGGHSHTFMFSGDNPPGPDEPKDEYPAIVNGVLIVQASAYTKYIGDLVVYFDENGKVTGYDGRPIYLDTSVTPDPDILEELKPWKEIVDETSLIVVGRSRVRLDKSTCSYDECNIGNLIADAFADHYASEAAGDGEWTSSAIAFTNNGGIRTSLTRGVLTFGDLITAVPFENTLDTLDLRGDHLIEMLEYSVSASFDEDRFNGKFMLHASGLQIVYNVSNPVNQRVVSVKVLCNKCDIPEYRDLDVQQMYRLIVPSFIANGGDGFEVVPRYRENHRIGPVDIEVFVKYVEKFSPIAYDCNGRVQVLT